MKTQQVQRKQLFKKIRKGDEIHIQVDSCKKPPYDQFKIVCHACKRNEACTFVNLRGFKKVNDQLLYGPYFPSTRTPTLKYKSRRFNTMPYSPRANIYALKKIRPTLQRCLQRQLDVLLHGSNKPIQRKHTKGYSHTCDSCSTNFFIHYYICAFCAIEICMDCYEALKNTLYGYHNGRVFNGKEHSQSEFVLFSKLSEKSITLLLKSPKPIQSTDVLTNTELINPIEVRKSELDQLKSAKSRRALDPRNLKSPMLPSQMNKTNEPNEPNEPELNRVPPILDKSQDYMNLPASQVSLEVFQKYWQTHCPALVTNSTIESKFEWTPQMFRSVCGADRLQATDFDNTVYELEAKSYFKAFSNRKRRRSLCESLGSSEVLKVKDWPPNQDLAKKLPGLYEDFMRTVPAPEYCSATGYLNLANRLPEEYVPPDLGPKLFISYGSDMKGKTGKTNLHCDITDAVNVMYYADDDTVNEKPQAPAVWHIFPYNSLRILKRYIRRYKKCNDLHPIFDHAFYLTAHDLQRLDEKYNVVPYTIYQNVGDTVFIPAGCAHQVTNYSNSIKCAFDFLSPENVERSLYISKQLRKLNKRDALQLQTTLAYAWLSLKKDSET
ncbi:uncharacterized protein EV154DRAFT_432375 [Mucor mucedo]|uniref:uncharacterized protein n=1 Tax=Mucor mucedo TaxID=29922 RepID=UPI00221E4333|nr:uncharacterized protein EV154DRAFT_432375 [Mucor mucedo]KAI7867476.1 hypothetical protein EV154DRAFT_432375 [Mucor mucedo]